MANLGPRMKRRRVKTDYRSAFSDLSGEASEAIADADRCVALLARLPANLPADIPRQYSF